MGLALPLALFLLCGPVCAPEPAITVAALEPEPVSLGDWQPPAVAVPVSVPALLERAAIRYGLSPQRLKRIAWCESAWRPWVTSSGGHMGLFQFSRPTWAWASAEAGYGGASPYDSVAAANVAAWLMAQPGGFSHWACK